MNVTLRDPETNAEVNILDRARLDQSCGVCHMGLLGQPVVSVTNVSNGWVCLKHLQIILDSFRLQKQFAESVEQAAEPRVMHISVSTSMGMFRQSLAAACHEAEAKNMQLISLVPADDYHTIAIFTRPTRKGDPHEEGDAS